MAEFRYPTPTGPKRGETVRQFLRRCRRQCPEFEWKTRHLSYGYGPRVIETRRPGADYWEHHCTWQHQANAAA